ncbi:MAG: hypothetical protein D4R65_13390 [Verrucomicrobiaceae bacterium]|nr:MAG: hypothetical protein D4R65_13390 [Verrucomicrobiaceae bacterium]
MKLRYLLLPVLLAALPSMLHASDSKRTADYIMTTPTDFEGKEVTLDVSFVKPSHEKSPIPEIAFFHAMTVDKQNRKPGGEIVVVVPSSSASNFAKKFGTDFEYRGESDSLKGIFMAAPGGPDRHGKVWVIDTTGKVGDLIKQHKLAIMDDKAWDVPGHGGAGGPEGPGGPHHGPHHPGHN